MVKVIKVSFHQLGYKEKEKEIILFENQEIREEPIEQDNWVSSGTTPEKEANEEKSLIVDFYIKLGNKIFERDYITLKCLKRERKIIKTIKEKGMINTITVYYLLEKEDFEYSLLKEIKKQEKNFCLTEGELIEESNKIIDGLYKWKHFRTQVEIDGCIADGLAFVGQEEHHTAKIIGFEAKTNKDNYLRLYSQLNAYLSICDEVYLIIEDKEPPKDLPFYVGIIKVEQGIGKIIREAQSLKHSIDVHECWSTLLKALNKHVGLERKTNTIQFFNAIDNIKRKLIWNQFVMGFHQSYVSEYVPLTEEEKRIVRTYFGKESSKLIQEVSANSSHS